MIARLTAAALLAGIALAACAPDFNPPPDYQGGFLWDGGRSRTISVGADDTLYSISRRYDVPVKVIVARNDLRAPYALRPGQTLILDPIRTHRVERGETVGTVATRYGVPQSAIVEANDLPAPYTLSEGQTVWIPDPFTVAAAEPLEPPPPRAAPTSTVMRVPAAPGATTAPSSGPAPVRSGGGQIASTALLPPPGATAMPGTPGAVTTLPPAEGEPPAVISPPQPDTARLSREGVTAMAAPPLAPNVPQPNAGMTTPNAPVPPPISPTDTAPPPAPPAPSLAPQPPTPTDQPPRPLPATPPVVAPPPQTSLPPQVAALPPAPQPAAGEAGDVAATKFVWPVQGRLISGFGPAGEGLHNDGINIAAPQGTQVRAAGNGTVVYGGNELKGFGNLLLIKHDNGLTTAYAHADKLLVAKGDAVRQGQVVGTVGKTGNVNAPQLHFEVRRGTQAVDPQPFLQR